MIRKLKGNNPYEMVKNANGDLAVKVQSLISRYAEDARAFELASEFIRWWNIPFDAPDKDETGRAIWEKAEKLMAVLDEEYGTVPVSMSPLERAGYAVGRQLGKVSAVTVNATVAGAKVTHRWMKNSAVPATRAGGREFWKGLKATARATRDAYREKRATRCPDSSDDLPY